MPAQLSNTPQAVFHQSQVSVGAAPQTVTPNPAAASTCKYSLANGAGTITVAAPLTNWVGARLRLIFLNPGTTVPSLSLNATYLVSWTPSVTASKRNVLDLEYDGSNWCQVAATVGI